ncbi:MAG: tRNA (adenosine(37)-N6)-dimethylallyltransferase MiaA [bacterium]|nr:tRNA (adenosine(37)-N6)-dimethylallyltransferase MiaA [bacterium]
MKKVLVVLGPTAIGKTDLALKLAKKFDGELISCDSRQVYQGLDIGTGKMPSQNSKIKSQRYKLKVQKLKSRWVINGISIWMYDVADPQVRYTVADYVKEAEKVIGNIIKKGKIPIIVGGTGLYLKALLEGLPNLSIPMDYQLRGELEKLSLEELQQIIQLLSPTGWKKLNDSDRKNPRRLLRSIELILMNPYIQSIKNLKFKIKNYNLLKIGLTVPRQVLKQRINLRLISRINQGLIEEGERLLKEGVTLKRMRELGLEYGMLAELLGGEISQKQFLEQLSVKISQYAKRQMTWFKKEKDVFWFDITKGNFSQEVEKIIQSWYDQADDKTD